MLLSAIRPGLMQIKGGRACRFFLAPLSDTFFQGGCRASLAVCVAALHGHRLPSAVGGRTAELSALIALLATAYMILSRTKAGLRGKAQGWFGCGFASEFGCYLCCFCRGC